MTNRLFLTTCLTPAALILTAPPLLAQTTVSSASTTPLATASAGDVTVASGGSITLGSGAAITVNSSNAATVASGGTLTLGAADGASGIVVNPGVTGTVSNAGAIAVPEDFTAANAGTTTIAAGPIAQASGRYGIHVLPGATGTGSITNSGTITIEGINSGGIVVDSPYSGSISNTGTISIKGDGSKGIATQGVNGNVAVNGTVTVVGQGAQAVVLNGDIGGTVSIQGALSQAASYTTDAATTQALSPDALRTGLAAVQVSGNVAGGVIVAAPAYGNTDTTIVTGSILAYGTSPALLIGGASDTVIGTVAGRDGTFSLALDGTATATANYSSTNAYGVVIGGQGGNVTMPGGIGVSGTIAATTYDSTATALLINAGSTVTTLSNSGTISAAITQAGSGSAYGVRDLSGTLTTLNNTGFIKVSGAGTGAVNAIDLSANTSGVTIAQYLNSIDKAAQVTEQAASGYTAANAVIYTSITGNIVTGSGNDLLDIQSGAIYGNSYLGAGDDAVKLSGDSHYVGDVHFGTGTASLALSGAATYVGVLDVADQLASLTIADTAKFAGTVTGGSQLAVSVGSGSTFGANKATTVAVNSLNVASGGTLNVYIDSGTASLIQANSATFAAGSKISATLTSLSNVAGQYTVVTAGSLSSAATFDTSAQLPVLFKGDLSVSGNSIILDIARKSAAELGLTRSQGQAYDAIFANGIVNTSLGASLLQASDVPGLQSQFEQLLPDHAGGVFDVVRRGSRLATRHLTDADSLFTISDVGGWLEPIYFKGSKDADGTVGYKTDGFGFSFGLERTTSLGYVGFSVAYIGGNVNTGDYQKVTSQDWEVGAFWRRAAGPLYTYARVGAGFVSLSSTRNFTGAVNSAALSYTAYGKWNGLSLNGAAGASYRINLGKTLTLKPMVSLDYYRLHEGAYQETGSAPMILAVDGRNSNALTATSTVTIGWSVAEPTNDYKPLTFEIEGGPRSALSGTLGTTTAAFTGGDRFSLTPDGLKSGWMAEARILESAFDHGWKLAAGAEKTAGGIDYSARASLSVAF